jgi:L-tryptophan--pyruvate aminotransferase
VHYDNAYQTNAGIKKLKDSIKELHEYENNIHESVINLHELVIGNGATQVLQAAIYATTKSTDKVYAKPPYYPRFPSIVQLCGTGAKFTSNPEEVNVEIITIPNNPDSKDHGRQTKADITILDASYNWDIYTMESYILNADIIIFSLAKALGAASTRIGWAFVRDLNIANKMREFIEIQSSDVSLAAQAEANYIIRGHLQSLNKYGRSCNYYDYPYAKSRSCYYIESWQNELNYSHLKFTNLFEHETNNAPLKVKIESDGGMFLWAKFEDEQVDAEKFFLDKLNIKCFGGERFGVSKNYFRFNLLSNDIKAVFYRIVLSDDLTHPELRSSDLLALF